MNTKAKALIPFTEVHVKGYLDRCIIHWRRLREGAEDMADQLEAECYIDAYQSVRLSLFGDLLPVEEELCE